MELGCDPDALDALATGHDAVQQRLRSLMAALAVRRAGASATWAGPDSRRWWDETDALRRQLGAQALRHRALARSLRRQADQQRRASLADPGHAVTLLDRAGDGRIVQRVGAADASTVIVLVPGVGTDLADRERLRTDAERVWSAAAIRAPDQGGGLAVVSWLGYDPPDSVPAGVRRRPAVVGAEQLAGDLDALRARGVDRVVVIGHSYGAVTAARAAAMRDAGSPGPDELVLLGSPGLPVAVDDLALRAGTGLWSATAAGDPIALVARSGAVHGSDPAAVARQLPTSLGGHGRYLQDPVLLDEIGRIAADRGRT